MIFTGPDGLEYDASFEFADAFEGESIYGDKIDMAVELGALMVKGTIKNTLRVSTGEKVSMGDLFEYRAFCEKYNR